MQPVRAILGQAVGSARGTGAWIYDVNSNKELEMLLARSPVYNFATFEVMPLAEMQGGLPVQPSQ